MKGDPRKLYLIGGILIGGILVLAYFILFPPAKTTEDNINDDIGTVEGDNANATLNENTNTEPIPTSGPLYDAARARDVKRLNDIRTYWSALNNFYGDKGNYPSRAEELIPDYLPSLPQDPKTGQTYNYTPIGVEPAKFYSLWYVLEVGIENLSAGDHEATPQSYASF